MTSSQGWATAPSPCDRWSASSRTSSPSRKRTSRLTVVTLPEPESGIEVLGVGDLLTRMARCCNPIGGHAIIGYITRGRGITVHRRTCPNIMRESESERLVEVDWGKTRTLYPVQIRVESWDRVGLLSDVTSLVADEGVNIVRLRHRCPGGRPQHHQPHRNH